MTCVKLFHTPRCTGLVLILYLISGLKGITQPVPQVNLVASNQAVHVQVQLPDNQWTAQMLIQLPVDFDWLNLRPFMSHILLNRTNIALTNNVHITIQAATTNAAQTWTTNFYVDLYPNIISPPSGQYNNPVYLQFDTSAYDIYVLHNGRILATNPTSLRVPPLTNTTYNILGCRKNTKQVQLYKTLNYLVTGFHVLNEHSRATTLDDIQDQARLQTQMGILPETVNQIVNQLPKETTFCFLMTNTSALHMTNTTRVHVQSFPYQQSPQIYNNYTQLVYTPEPGIHLFTVEDGGYVFNYVFSVRKPDLKAPAGWLGWIYQNELQPMPEDAVLADDWVIHNNGENTLQAICHVEPFYQGSNRIQSIVLGMGQSRTESVYQTARYTVRFISTQDPQQLYVQQFILKHAEMHNFPLNQTNTIFLTQASIQLPLPKGNRHTTRTILQHTPIIIPNLPLDWETEPSSISPDKTTWPVNAYDSYYEIICETPETTLRGVYHVKAESDSLANSLAYLNNIRYFIYPNTQEGNDAVQQYLREPWKSPSPLLKFNVQQDELYEEYNIGCFINHTNTPLYALYPNASKLEPIDRIPPGRTDPDQGITEFALFIRDSSSLWESHTNQAWGAYVYLGNVRLQFITRELLDGKPARVMQNNQEQLVQWQQPNKTLFAAQVASLPESSIEWPAAPGCHKYYGFQFKEAPHPLEQTLAVSSNYVYVKIQRPGFLPQEVVLSSIQTASNLHSGIHYKPVTVNLNTSGDDVYYLINAAQHAHKTNAQRYSQPFVLDGNMPGKTNVFLHVWIGDAYFQYQLSFYNPVPALLVSGHVGPKQPAQVTALNAYPDGKGMIFYYYGRKFSDFLTEDILSYYQNNHNINIQQDQIHINKPFNGTFTACQPGPVLVVYNRTNYNLPTFAQANIPPLIPDIPISTNDVPQFVSNRTNIMAYECISHYPHLDYQYNLSLYGFDVYETYVSQGTSNYIWEISHGRKKLGEILMPQGNVQNINGTYKCCVNITLDPYINITPLNKPVQSVSIFNTRYPKIIREVDLSYYFMYKLNTSWKATLTNYTLNVSSQLEKRPLHSYIFYVYNISRNNVVYIEPIIQVFHDNMVFTDFAYITNVYTGLKIDYGSRLNETVMGYLNQHKMAYVRFDEAYPTNMTYHVPFNIQGSFDKLTCTLEYQSQLYTNNGGYFTTILPDATTQAEVTWWVHIPWLTTNYPVKRTYQFQARQPSVILTNNMIHVVPDHEQDVIQVIYRKTYEIEEKHSIYTEPMPAYEGVYAFYATRPNYKQSATVDLVIQDTYTTLQLINNTPVAFNTQGGLWDLTVNNMRGNQWNQQLLPEVLPFSTNIYSVIPAVAMQLVLNNRKPDVPPIYVPCTQNPDGSYRAVITEVPSLTPQIRGFPDNIKHEIRGVNMGYAEDVEFYQHTLDIPGAFFGSLYDYLWLPEGKYLATTTNAATVNMFLAALPNNDKKTNALALQPGKKHVLYNYGASLENQEAVSGIGKTLWVVYTNHYNYNVNATLKLLSTNVLASVYASSNEAPMAVNVTQYHTVLKPQETVYYQLDTLYQPSTNILLDFSVTRETLYNRFNAAYAEPFFNGLVVWQDEIVQNTSQEVLFKYTVVGFTFGFTNYYLFNLGVPVIVRNHVQEIMPNNMVTDDELFYEMPAITTTRKLGINIPLYQATFSPYNDKSLKLNTYCVEDTVFYYSFTLDKPAYFILNMGDFFMDLWNVESNQLAQEQPQLIYAENRSRVWKMAKGSWKLKHTVKQRHREGRIYVDVVNAENISNNMCHHNIKWQRYPFDNGVLHVYEQPENILQNAVCETQSFVGTIPDDGMLYVNNNTALVNGVPVNKSIQWKDAELYVRIRQGGLKLQMATLPSNDHINKPLVIREPRSYFVYTHGATSDDGGDPDIWLHAVIPGYLHVKPLNESVNIYLHKEGTTPMEPNKPVFLSAGTIIQIRSGCETVLELYYYPDKSANYTPETAANVEWIVTSFEGDYGMPLHYYSAYLLGRTDAGETKAWWRLVVPETGVLSFKSYTTNYYLSETPVNSNLKSDRDTYYVIKGKTYWITCQFGSNAFVNVELRLVPQPPGDMAALSVDNYARQFAAESYLDKYGQPFWVKSAKELALVPFTLYGATYNGMTENRILDNIEEKGPTAGQVITINANRKNNLIITQAVNIPILYEYDKDSTAICIDAKVNELLGPCCKSGVYNSFQYLPGTEIIAPNAFNMLPVCGRLHLTYNAAPENDEKINATVLNPADVHKCSALNQYEWTITGDNTHATGSVNDPVSSGHTLWYVFKPPVPGTIRITAENSPIDVVITANNIQALNAWGPLNISDSLYICIDTLYKQGPFIFKVIYQPDKPVNDAFQDALPLIHAACGTLNQSTQEAYDFPWGFGSVWYVYHNPYNTNLTSIITLQGPSARMDVLCVANNRFYLTHTNATCITNTIPALAKVYIRIFSTESPASGYYRIDLQHVAPVPDLVYITPSTWFTNQLRIDVNVNTQIKPQIFVTFNQTNTYMVYESFYISNTCQAVFTVQYPNYEYTVTNYYYKVAPVYITPSKAFTNEMLIVVDKYPFYYRKSLHPTNQPTGSFRMMPVTGQIRLDHSAQFEFTDDPSGPYRIFRQYTNTVAKPGYMVTNQMQYVHTTTPEAFLVLQPGQHRFETNRVVLPMNFIVEQIIASRSGWISSTNNVTLTTNRSSLPVVISVLQDVPTNFSAQITAPPGCWLKIWLNGEITWKPSPWTFTIDHRFLLNVCAFQPENNSYGDWTSISRNLRARSPECQRINQVLEITNVNSFNSWITVNQKPVAKSFYRQPLNPNEVYLLQIMSDKADPSDPVLYTTAGENLFLIYPSMSGPWDVPQQLHIQGPENSLITLDAGSDKLVQRNLLSYSLQSNINVSISIQHQDTLFTTNISYIFKVATPVLYTEGDNVQIPLYCATPDVVFWVSVDNQAFSPLPGNYLPLQPGNHTYKVKAVRDNWLESDVVVKQINLSSAVYLRNQVDRFHVLYPIYQGLTSVEIRPYNTNLVNSDIYIYTHWISMNNQPPNNALYLSQPGTYTVTHWVTQKNLLTQEEIEGPKNNTDITIKLSDWRALNQQGDPMNYFVGRHDDGAVNQILHMPVWLETYTNVFLEAVGDNLVYDMTPYRHPQHAYRYLIAGNLVGKDHVNLRYRYQPTQQWAYFKMMFQTEKPSGYRDGTKVVYMLHSDYVNQRIHARFFFNNVLEQETYINNGLFIWDLKSKNVSDQDSWQLELQYAQPLEILGQGTQLIIRNYYE